MSLSPLQNFGLGGDDRRETGRQHFTQVLTLLLKDVSHPEMALLADWACNESGNLHTSQISHLRNAKMRMLGVKSLDALGRINQAAHYYKADRRGAFAEICTAATTARIEEILERFVPLMQDDEVTPMNSGDLMMIYLGYLRYELPESDTESYEAAVENVPQWFADLFEEKGVSFRDGLKLVQSKWTGSSDECSKFCSVLAGIDSYKADELANVWLRVSQVASAILDEDVSEQELLELVNS
jgi:hypothetical protein|tara:strand:+ start:122 stop:844 length:723 start_codon:yes stop_codon:yes gene_type:complete